VAGCRVVGGHRIRCRHCALFLHEHFGMSHAPDILLWLFIVNDGG
jgi:hypothetical protein